jgi:hypothetical protein
MAKQRKDIMQDDPIVMIYLIVMCTVLTLLGMSMA